MRKELMNTALSKRFQKSILHAVRAFSPYFRVGNLYSLEPAASLRLEACDGELLEQILEDACLTDHEFRTELDVRMVRIPDVGQGELPARCLIVGLSLDDRGRAWAEMIDELRYDDEAREGLLRGALSLAKVRAKVREKFDPFRATALEPEHLEKLAERFARELVERQMRRGPKDFLHPLLAAEFERDRARFSGHAFGA